MVNLTLKFIWKHKGMAKAILKKADEVGSIILLNIKTLSCYSNLESIVSTKELIHRSMKKNIKPRNICIEIQSFDFFDKDAKAILCRKDSFFNKWG